MSMENPIKMIRNQIGASQRELADFLDVHHSYVANLENNLISIDDEDPEEQSKIVGIFKRIAEWSGMDADKLINDQKECVEASTIKVKKSVAENLQELAADWGGSSLLKDDEAVFFIEKLKEYIKDQGKSPIAVIRDACGITQRNFALAADVSQAYIARLERGELTLNGPYTGLNVINLIMNAIVDANDKTNAEEYIFEAIGECQEQFILSNKERTKKKIEEAFNKINKKNVRADTSK